MMLKGYRPETCAAQKGGVKTVALIDAGGIVDVVWDSETDLVTSITLKEGIKAAVYHFPEDNASYTEKLSAENGSISVTHRLVFSLSPMGHNSRMAAEQLALNSNNGMVALIITPNNKALLAGYSPYFATERALRVASIEALTGSKPTDPTLRTITLVAVDTLQSKYCNADLSAIIG